MQSRLDWPSNQKLFYHYQHAKLIESIRSIRQIIYEIHLIEGSNDLEDLIHFLTCQPNNFKVTPNFPKFHFISSTILEMGYPEFGVSRPERLYPFPNQYNAKIIKVTFKFTEFLLTLKIGLLHWFLLEIHPLLVS